MEENLPPLAETTDNHKPQSRELRTLNSNDTLINTNHISSISFISSCQWKYSRHTTYKQTMIVSKYNAITIVVVAAISFQVYKNIMFFGRPGRTLPIVTITTTSTTANANENCTLYPGPWGAEDFVVTKFGGWAIFSSLDASLYPNEPLDEQCDPHRSGGLWMFNIQDPNPDPPQRITNNNNQDPQSLFPRHHEDEESSSPCILTHGLFLSNQTDLLYVVTHRKRRSSIEVFQLDYSVFSNSEGMYADAESSSSPPPPKLTWVRSIHSDKFPRSGINAAVEGTDPHELYVTVMIPYSIPSTGARHPKTLWDIIHLLANLPIPIAFGFKWTHVLKCNISTNTHNDDDDHTNDDVSCVDATDGTVAFQMANGIAITSDRQTVFVCDSTLYSIGVFHRSVTGILEPKGYIDLEYACDNLMWDDDTKELLIGTIGDPMLALSNALVPIEEHAPVPGGLTVATQKAELKGGGGGGDDDDGDGDYDQVWETRLVYSHDGTKLSAVSSAKKYGTTNRFIFGSPAANGILVCQA